jgi:hypothetical protein
MTVTYLCLVHLLLAHNPTRQQIKLQQTQWARIPDCHPFSKETHTYMVEHSILTRPKLKCLQLVMAVINIKHCVKKTISMMSFWSQNTKESYL